MKKYIITIIAALCGSISVCTAQSYWPNQTVQEMTGQRKPVSDYAPAKGAVLFVFWKTCCPNNITMIDELEAVWEQYHDDTALITIVLVSVDDQRSVSRVRPIVSSECWPWPVIMDRNGDLARTYQVIMPPQWVAADKHGRVIYRSKVTNGELDSAIYFEELVNTLKSNN